METAWEKQIVCRYHCHQIARRMIRKTNNRTKHIIPAVIYLCRDIVKSLSGVTCARVPQSRFPRMPFERGQSFVRVGGSVSVLQQGFFQLPVRFNYAFMPGVYA